MKKMKSASEMNIRVVEMTQSTIAPGCNMLPCKMTRNQKLILVSMSLLKFVSLASFSVIAPFYPSEAKAKHVAEVVTGAVFTVFAASNFVASPFIGKIIAEVGPKIVLLTGTFLLGISSLLFGLLDDVEDTQKFSSLCIVVRMFEGVGCGATGISIFTYIAEVFPRRTGIIMGVMEVITGIGLSTGPAVGGYLYSVGGYQAPFIVLGMICLATIPVNYYLLPASTTSEESRLHSLPRIGSEKVSKWNLAVNPRFLIAAMSVSAISCGTAFLSPLLELHLRKLGMDATEIGMMFLFTPIAYGIVSPVSGWISDENPRWRRLQTAFGLFFVGLSFMLIGPSPLLYPLKSVLWLNVLALCIKGLGSTFALVPTFQIMLDAAMEIIGPSLGTGLSSSFGFGWAATGEAVFSFLIMFLMFVSHFTQKSTAEDEEDDDGKGEATSLLRPS